MNHRTNLASFAGLLAVLAGGCESENAPGGSAGSGGAGAASCDVSDGRLVITDDTNYALPSTLDVELVTLKDATDLRFDWSELTRDFYGRTLDPRTDIDMVLVSLWSMTPDVLEENLEKDNLPLSENKGVITSYPSGDVTSTNLLSFDLLGNPIPEAELWGFFDTKSPNFQYPQDAFTFLVIASTGTDLGRNARMLKFFHIDPNATETALSLTNESASLAFDVNLTSARPVRVPLATPNVLLDWADMTTNALGNRYLPSQVTRAVVAHFPTATLEELETRFLELESLADGWWEKPITSGLAVDLATLVDTTGAAFPGISGDGTWLAALFCTANCNNPAPWSITILKPCP